MSQERPTGDEGRVPHRRRRHSHTSMFSSGRTMPTATGAAPPLLLSIHRLRQFPVTGSDAGPPLYRSTANGMHSVHIRNTCPKVQGEPRSDPASWSISETPDDSSSPRPRVPSKLIALKGTRGGTMFDTSSHGNILKSAVRGAAAVAVVGIVTAATPVVFVTPVQASPVAPAHVGTVFVHFFGTCLWLQQVGREEVHRRFHLLEAGLLVSHRASGWNGNRVRICEGNEMYGAKKNMAVLTAGVVLAGLTGLGVAAPASAEPSPYVCYYTKDHQKICLDDKTAR